MISQRPGVLPELLIIGRSGRALAASAARAGYDCDVIDAFADTDTRVSARRVWSADSFDIPTLTPLLEDWWRSSHGTASPPSLILPGSGFEAKPAVLSWLDRYGTVAGNTAAVVSRFKDPAQFFPLLDRFGIAHPHVSLLPVTMAGDWLSKPIGGEGGVGIRPWSPDEPLPAGRYLQQRGSGQAVSVVFLADGRRVRVIGFNRCLTMGQLNGDPADYRFAGAVTWQAPARLQTLAAEALHKLVRATGLRGLGGMDVLWQDDTMSVLEVNPRPPASFELHEAAHENGGSLVAAHLSACAGVLSERLLAAAVRQQGVSGKQVVYCDEPVYIPAGFPWPAWTADRPAAGSRLEANTPLCTIRARAETNAACREALQQYGQDLLSDIKKSLQVNDYQNLSDCKEVNS